MIAHRDGHISFDDFREFLLLMSRPASFKEIVSFYRASKPIRRPSHQVTQDGGQHESSDRCATADYTG